MSEQEKLRPIIAASLVVMTIEAMDRLLGEAPLWLYVTCRRVGAKARAYGCLGSSRRPNLNATIVKVCFYTFNPPLCRSSCELSKSREFLATITGHFHLYLTTALQHGGPPRQPSR